MLDDDVDRAARQLREELADRIHEYWRRNGARKHWWQINRDPLSREDELLIARAEWILAFLVNRRRSA